MNLNYEFNVHYYDELKTKDGLKKEHIHSMNKALTEAEWSADRDDCLPALDGQSSLFFKVLYPGLLAGLGNSHTAGQRKEEGTPEIGLGFSLDYVTGLPFIPGSTIKGVLRSAFIQSPGYIRECLGKTADELPDGLVDRLEDDIFGSKHPHDSSREADSRSMGRDVFLDAYPVKADSSSHLMGMENITPHRADDPKMDGLKNPVPLNLLKVRPGVVFRFDFILQDSTVTENQLTFCLDKKKKLELFKTILEDFGAGAKTNVGFGLLEAVTAPNSEGILISGQITPEVSTDNPPQNSSAGNRRDNQRSGERNNNSARTPGTAVISKISRRGTLRLVSFSREK